MNRVNGSFALHFFALDFFRFKGDTYRMDTGQTLYLASQLILGAAACFFAIMLWPRTRDAAWMLIIIGVIVLYIETVYSVLKLFGIGIDDTLYAGSVPVIPFILPSIRMVLFIVAFAIMYHKHTRQKQPE